jgi:hypothetical protein
MAETFTDDYGQDLYNVHDRRKCWGPNCPIHAPSTKARLIGKLKWRTDSGFFERICIHGIGHPDPDQVLQDGEGIHGCDGCCV